MIQTIANGISAIIDIFKTLFDFIRNIISSGVELFASLPDIIKAVTAAVGVLPTVLLSATMFVISIRLVVLILNKKAGE